MKKLLFKAALCGGIFATLFFPAEAQVSQPVSGNWVVETNTIKQNYSVVRFYNQQKTLIYEEKLYGVHLDVTKPKTRKMLDKTLKNVLNSTLVAWQTSKGAMTAHRMVTR
ncbi:hypothetical protein ACFSKU_20115 [Pontibacter silvestris]|uniref:Lipocalin-like domain-containing protein n=1 Tax=Pontibacter silvestris TaxID=2305183 RepID=A0ABW4X4D2_9BACT|nr:hypothetical protein [Pontibacter silvestris]MCC9134813.1 hypothetical protein [Pontibacter silvestris]